LRVQKYLSTPIRNGTVEGVQLLRKAALSVGSAVKMMSRPTDPLWPTGDGRLSELLAPNRPVRSGLERQQSGVDFANRGTRPRPAV
jgi:hypothetical protein